MRENLSTKKKINTTSYKFLGTMDTISKVCAWFSLKPITDNDSELSIYVWMTQLGRDLKEKKTGQPDSVTHKSKPPNVVPNR